MPFQTVVNTFPAPAVEGDFASDNPRNSMTVGDTQLLTGSAGVTVGRFAWANAAGVVTNAKPGSGVARLGVACRSGQEMAFFQTWLAGFSLLLPSGLPIVLHTKVDVWMKATVAAATIGEKAFASLTDGSMQPAAAGATVAGYVETSWIVISAGNIGDVVMLSQEG